MRKILVLMLFALLSIASVSQVMADYELPTGTIDIPQPSEGNPCLTDAGQGYVGFDCCDLDAGQGYIGNPCCNFGSAGQGYIGNPCCELSAGQGYIGDLDPCELPCVFGGSDGIPDCCEFFEFEINADSTLPAMISLDNYSTEITNLDAVLGLEAFDCDEEESAVEPQEEGSDLDADGILDESDNCPTDYNPDQKNSWGTGAGDACETPYRSDNNLVFGFFGEDNVGFYGFCTEEGCQYIATVTPTNFAGIMGNDDYQDAGDFSDELAGGKVLNSEDGNPSSLTVLFQVGTDEDGNPIYQINIYILQQKLGEDGETEVFPMLVDDDVNIIVKPDGTWTWWDKNPN